MKKKTFRNGFYIIRNGLITLKHEKMNLLTAQNEYLAFYLIIYPLYF